MRSRKILCVLITVLLLVVSFSAAFPMADEEGRTFELPEGLTITLPSEFEGVLWVGMDENDPLLHDGYDMDTIMELYEEDGLVLQCDAPPVGEDNGQIFFVTAYVKAAPSDVSESTFLNDVTSNQISEEKDLESLEILQKGVIHVGDIDIYKTVSEMALNFDYEVQARYKERVYKYAFVTETGKLHEIEIELLSDPRNPDDAIPFTDEDLAHLDDLANYIIGSVKLEGKTVSIDAEPLDMAADAEGRTFELPEGITVTLPADFAEVYWVGMSENDSEMTKQYGVQPILDLYDEEGVALQGEAPPLGADDGQIFFVMVHVKDAPSDLSEDTFIANVPENEIDSPESLESMEILKKGVIRSGDMDLYKTTSDLTVNFEGHARYKLRTNKYSFISEAGKLYEIEIQVVSSPENPDVPFTEEDLSHLEYLESYILGSVKLEGKTVSIEAEPFPTSEENSNTRQGEEPSSAEKPESETSAPKKVKKTFFQSFTTFEFPIWLIACGMMLLLFLGAKVSKRHEWQEEPLSLSTSKGIQGFAAVAIILHHLSQELVDKAGPLEFLSGCGVLFVGIFFFF
ncbi:MAG: hypothetical protein J6040_04395, partial [Clostridiales bacterium]|nr:hypothetical protein [Clostridiales bacterium]